MRLRHGNLPLQVVVNVATLVMAGLAWLFRRHAIQASRSAGRLHSETMKHPFVLSLVSAQFCLAAPLCLAGPADAFHDDFTTLNRARWYLSDGWSNGEHQGCEWQAREVAVEAGRLLLNLHDRATRTRPLSCSEVQSTARYGHGRYEVRMKSARGAGLNSAFFTYIGPNTPGAVHDEIDFEFLGKNSRTVDINFWRAGKSYGGKTIQLGFDASEEFHDYAFEWSADHIVWFVDGKEVHRVGRDANLPIQTQKMFLTLWSGSATIKDWMGTFSYGGPARAEVDWVRYTPMQ